MDFSARAAKASGLGREKRREEEGWEPLMGGVPHSSLPCGETLPALRIICWKELVVDLPLLQASPPPCTPRNPLSSKARIEREET